MPVEKKVFFGSLFEFREAAITEIIETFQESFQDPTSAPFVSYDGSTHTFSFTCDSQDNEAVPRFLGQIKAYVEQQQEDGGYEDRDLVGGSPKIRPFEGTVVQKLPDLEDGQEEGPDLIEVPSFSNSDSDVDNDEGFIHGMSHMTVYWEPKDGGIKILTTGVAKAIAELTGTSLYPELEKERVQIQGGDFRQALSKLKNLEDLLCFTAAQKGTGSSKANGNVIIVNRFDEDTVIEFVPLLQHHLGAQRILVEERGLPYLSRKCLGEIRTRQPRQNVFEIPESLREISPTSEIRDARIWTEVKFPGVGTPDKLQPRARSNTPPLEHAVPEKIHVRDNSSSRFISTKDAGKIKSWNKAVTDDVDPNSIPVEPPSESPAEIRLRSKLRRSAESEDENELPEASSPALPTRRRVVKTFDSDSDADDEKVLEPRKTSDLGPSRQQLEPDPSTPKNRRSFVQPVLQAPTPATALPRNLLQVDTAPYSRDLLIRLNEDRTSSSKEVPNSPSQRPLSATDGQSLHMTTQDKTNDCASSSEFHASSPTIGLLASFDLSKYAKRTRGAALGGSSSSPARGQGRMRGSPRGAAQSQSRAESQMTLQNRVKVAGHGHGEVHRGNCETGRNPMTPQLDTLIQYDDSEIPTRQVTTPPGFDIRIALPQIEQNSPQLNVLDSPNEEIQHPSLPPSRPMSTDPFGDNAPPCTTASCQSPATVGLYVNHRNPGLQIEKIQDEVLKRLRKTQKEENERNTAQKKRFERKQQHSEGDKRDFRKTMGQKAGNPGKGRNQPQQKESKKQKQERLSKAMNEAYGNPKSSYNSLVSGQEEPEEMSTAKMKLLKKNPELTKQLPSTADNEPYNEQTNRLISAMGAAMEASRAFTGTLNLEVQFGQVLIPNLVRADKLIYYTLKMWDELFNPKHGQSPPAASFTNILTTNGADIDRILEIQSQGSSKLWDRLNPGPSRIEYEFHCQSKDNEEFWVVVDENGNYRLRKAATTVGMTNLHYPSQVWDATFVLFGEAHWTNQPQSVLDFAKAFVNSLYVPPDQKEILITYRLPSTNDITIRNLTMRRKSLHNCRKLDRESFQLKITEVQTLYHRFHSQDQKLGQGLSKSYAQMVAEGKIHFEASILHKGINETLLKHHETLELGELTDVRNTGKALLVKETMRHLLELTSFMLARLDFAGARNIGSLIRSDQAKTVQGINPPTTHVGPIRHNGPAASFMTPSVIQGSVRLPNVSTVRGVRMDTPAELFPRPDGTWYALGMGGAHVPPKPEDLERLRELGYAVTGMALIAEENVKMEEDLRPDDSASQSGATMRKPPEAALWERPVVGYRRNMVPGPRSRPHGRSDREPGYW